MSAEMRKRERAKDCALAACMLLAAVACSDPTEADDPIVEPSLDSLTAQLQVDSAVAEFECAYSAFGLFALGHEDVLSSVSGIGSSNHVYAPSARGGSFCDATDTSVAWFDQVMSTRTRLVSPDTTGVYQRLRDPSTTLTPAFEDRLSAIAAIYMAAVFTHLGEFFCEVTLDGGPLLEPDDVLAMAEEWITYRALVHIAESGGDFALPGGIATSAQTTALALRARLRWARGDLFGAAADAANVPQGFSAWVTRDAGPRRRNKIYSNATFQGYSGIPPLSRSWQGPSRAPNPATGLTWPAILPFTGYIFLGITPDGRTLEAGNVPVRWANEVRSSGSLAPIPCNGSSLQPGCVIGAVQDTRVPIVSKQIQTNRVEIPNLYQSDADDIPLINWEEMWLIRAEHAAIVQAGTAGRQAAIDRVNDLRTAAGLPLVTYLSAATATPNEMRYLLLEERRRVFFLDGGRYWSTKLQNLDALWFPRRQGSGMVYNYQGGVRLAMPDQVYTTNPNLVALGGLAARGTGCGAAAAPSF